jgi:hypothetical protein
MSHHFIVPTNENGLLLDQTINADIQRAMDPLFAFADVFIYSHGWWTDAIRAMEGYNRFTIEFSRYFRALPGLHALPTLNMGVHWPSTLTEDRLSILNYVEALSFYTMEKRADAIGENAVYALLQFVLTGRQAAGPLRLHLLGHSFGCKVVCKALQRLVESSAANPLPADVSFDVVLLQAAFDNDQLEAGQTYGSVLGGLPGLRVLVTRSDEDSALGNLYPRAHRLAHLLGAIKPALGASGPTAATAAQAGGAAAVQVAPGFDQTTAGRLAARLTVADLTPLHQANPDGANGLSGHHSDIFHPEICGLLAAFYFQA